MQARMAPVTSMLYVVGVALRLKRWSYSSGGEWKVRLSSRKKLVEVRLPRFYLLIGPMVRAIIHLVGAKEVIVLVLLKAMSEPPCYPGHGKDRCKKIGFDAHAVVNDT